VRERLKDGQEVVFDATNYCEKLRSMPVQAGRWCAAEIVTYFFDVGLAEALRRNRERQRSVPPEIIRKHFRGLEPPLLYEADRHVVVGEDGSAVPYWPPQG
jgi:predicted kinase